MHGRVLPRSKTCRSLERSCCQHMQSVLPLATPVNTVVLTGENQPHCDPSITTSSSCDSFSKDGRKIWVGDCALFKLPKSSPPFIGLICWLALDNENNLQVGVHWLFRSFELKLGKGTSLDNAPNEVFYSFLKGEVPATSLLHPCKVAFLPRGVELPIGTSSFICRRAYDIANKSLGWLTDPQFITDQQEQINRILYKTKSEMHQTLQTGARSPKLNNGLISTSQTKVGSDNAQNSGNVLSHVKGKRGERRDHGSESIKRGRFTQPDDSDSAQCKTESDLKHEIAKIAEKAGEVDLDGVEKLVQLMQLDTPERKLDLGSRSMLADVLASIDRGDCLGRFVQMRGLPVLDSWLQDIHKGKIDEGYNIKDVDKSVEEFLLVLLRALGKIPVNLQALQMCNIGRSVNHLRSHKNIEIQRKARTLVDTWKKRVEAEMSSIDVKSSPTQAGSPWPSKSRPPDASHGYGGNRTPDCAMKSSLTQNPPAKTSSGRSSPGESGNKYASSSSGPVRVAPTPASGEGSLLRSSGGGPVDILQIREDRSSSSNLSQNNGQSLSMKGDFKSSASVSVTVNKTSSTETRNKRNGVFSGASTSTSQKEPSSSRSSPVHKKIALEKSSHSEITGERVVEGPISGGNIHKLIVKIPNCVSPAQGVYGYSSEDPMIMSSQGASPVQKHMQSDVSSKDKGEAFNENTDQNHPLTCSLGAVPPLIFPEVGQSMVIDSSKGLNEITESENSKSENLHVSSFSPMNALVESCAKYSEATFLMSLDDYIGMNLLASVAAGEISRSDAVTPNESTERMMPAGEEVCSGVETKSKSSPKDYSSEVPNQVYNDGCDCKKQAVLSSCSRLNLASSKDIDISFIELRSNTEPKSGIDDMVTEEENSTIHSDTGECKLMVGDAVSKPLGEIKSNKSQNEGFITASILLSKQNSTDDKPVIEKNTSKKDLGRPKCDQKLVSVADGSVKVVELDVKDTKGYMCNSERLESNKEVRKNEGIQSQAFSCSTSPVLNSHCETCLETQEIAESSLPESKCQHSVKQESQKDELRENSCASILSGNTGQSTSACTGYASFVHAVGTENMKFDLNESFNDDDSKYEESVMLPSTVKMVNSLPFSVSSIPIGHSASITAASTAKSTLFPPDELLRSNVDFGWKGSASTSAFHPAERKKFVDMTVGTSISCYTNTSTNKHDRFPLDIDLNVPDERLLEEIASLDSALAVESSSDLACKVASLLSETPGMEPSFGGLDFDLNRADEAHDNVPCSTSSNHHGETSIAHAKPVSNLHIQRNFDLNDGPASVRQFPVSQLVKSSVAAQLPSAGFTFSNHGPGNFTSMFSPVKTYSTVAIPSVLPDRGDQSFPVFPSGAPQRSFSPSGVAQFNPDIYRGSVLPSSPAIPFPSSPFQYPVFPFGAPSPLPSGTFAVGGTSYQNSTSSSRFFSPSINSQYLEPVGNVSTQFQRPFVGGIADVNTNGGMNSNHRWGRPGLDLNMGPSMVEGEVKEVTLPHSSGQQSVFQAITEEQAHVLSLSRGVLKRREPGGNWDSESNRHRHSSWK